MQRNLKLLGPSALVAMTFSVSVAMHAMEHDHKDPEAPPSYDHPRHFMPEDNVSVQRLHERIQQLEQEVAEVRKAEGADKQRVKALQEAEGHEGLIPFDKHMPRIDECIKILNRLNSRDIRYGELSDLCAKLDQHYAESRDKSSTINNMIKLIHPYHEELNKRSAIMLKHTELTIPAQLLMLQRQGIIDVADRVRAGGGPPPGVKVPLEEVIALIQEDLFESAEVYKKLHGELNPLWDEIEIGKIQIAVSRRREDENRQKLAQKAAEARKVAEAEEKDPAEKGPAMPLAAKGHEATYLRFLNGALIYKPNRNGVGMVTLPIAKLANPLGGEFDLSQFGDTGQYLRIATGFRKDVKNDSKAEIWFTPRFLVEKELNASASHLKPIFGNWDARHAVGIFWSWSGDVLKDFDYLTMDKLGSDNLYEKWRVAGAEGRGVNKCEFLRAIHFMFIL